MRLEKRLHWVLNVTKFQTKEKNFILGLRLLKRSFSAFLKKMQTSVGIRSDWSRPRPKFSVRSRSGLFVLRPRPKLDRTENDRTENGPGRGPNFARSGPVAISTEFRPNRNRPGRERTGPRSKISFGPEWTGPDIVRTEPIDFQVNLTWKEISKEQ